MMIFGFDVPFFIVVYYIALIAAYNFGSSDLKKLIKRYKYFAFGAPLVFLLFAPTPTDIPETGSTASAPAEVKQVIEIDGTQKEVVLTECPNEEVTMVITVPATASPDHEVRILLPKECLIEEYVSPPSVLLNDTTTYITESDVLDTNLLNNKDLLTDSLGE